MISFMMLETKEPETPYFRAVCEDCDNGGYVALERLHSGDVRLVVLFLCPRCFVAREAGGF